MVPRRAMVVAGSAFLILLILVSAAPFMFPCASFLGLDGFVGVMDHDWSGYGASGLIYAFGDIICHQAEYKTFMLNGSEMPVCARDLGLLIGFVIGMFVASTYEPLADNRTALIGLVLLLLTLAEWCIEQFGFESIYAKFAVGIPSGFGAALIVGWLIYRNMVGHEAL